MILGGMAFLSNSISSMHIRDRECFKYCPYYRIARSWCWDHLYKIPDKHSLSFARISTVKGHLFITFQDNSLLFRERFDFSFSLLCVFIGLLASILGLSYVNHNKKCLFPLPQDNLSIFKSSCFLRLFLSWVVFCTT